ncbi:MAG: glycosyltransferase [Methanomicrobia archaeon]|nr:glycosyltransferase [Methanomicrobia archaeon]
MRTSVIVCSYGGQEELVARCIASLEHQTHIPDEVILVVDTDDEKISYSDLFCGKTRVPIRVVSSGKKGLAAARNKGVETALGDIIAFIDDDAEADENWLANIFDSFSGKVMVVGGSVKPVFRGKKLDSKLNWVIDCTTTNPPPKRPIGCNMAFTKRVFEALGGFDESLGMVRRKMAVGEETDLFLRIKKRYGPDAKIVFNPDAVVYHHVPEERTKWRYMLRRAHAEGLAKASIGKEYDLEVEQTYLKYYLKHLDVMTFFLLLAAGIGYLRGKLRM